MPVSVSVIEVVCTFVMDELWLIEADRDHVLDTEILVTVKESDVAENVP